MNQKQIEEYSRTKKGAIVEYKPEWECVWGQIEKKMFLAIHEDSKGNKYVSLKCDPELSDIYRNQYEDIIPGYHFNKQHWNSVRYLKQTVPDEVIIEMIDMSYNLVLNKLPKKIREKYL